MSNNQGREPIGVRPLSPRPSGAWNFVDQTPASCIDVANRGFVNPTHREPAQTSVPFPAAVRDHGRRFLGLLCALHVALFSAKAVAVPGPPFGGGKKKSSN